MNTAIECRCGTVVIYDIELLEFLCPHCHVRWFREPPPLICDSGEQAKRLPYLCQEVAAQTLDDEVALFIMQEIKRGVDNHNRMAEQCGWGRADYPDRITFICADGRSEVFPFLESLAELEATGKQAEATT